MIDWARVTDERDHRPWPLPDRPWIMTMSWVDLLFAHFRVPADALRPAIPPPLELDLYRGEAWVSVVPFRMENVAPRGVTLPPVLSGFPELNVRTYVTVGDRPGVWFYSLDATSRVAIAGARLAFHLPYFRADMELERRDDWYHYSSRRADDGAAFRGRYRSGERRLVAPGSLDHWLTERYCLYSADGQGRVLRGDIHHRPWPVHGAEAVLEENGVANRAGLTLGLEPDALHFSPSLDVVAWSLDPV